MRSYCLLPRCLFSSRTLVVLKLGGGFVLGVPEVISLESLKILHFDSVEFEDSESFSRLVSSCLVLKELKVIGELSESVKVLTISSLSLKRLLLSGLYALRFPEIGRPHLYEVVLNTPSLQYLEHHEESGLPDGYHTNTLHCLDTACLGLFFSYCQLEEYDDELILARSMADLAVALSNVRFLYILENAFEVLFRPAMRNFELPKFPRLTYLKIDPIESDAGLRLLSAFLRSSPHLASLSFALQLSHESWYPPTVVPVCMLYNLRVIEVDYLFELEPVLGMVKYFLEKTNCLKELRIRRKKVKNEKFIKDISMLPRASSSCKIVLT